MSFKRMCSESTENNGAHATYRAYRKGGLNQASIALRIFFIAFFSN
jgi:hypothetical protein